MFPAQSAAIPETVETPSTGIVVGAPTAEIRITELTAGTYTLPAASAAMHWCRRVVQLDVMPPAGVESIPLGSIFRTVKVNSDVLGKELSRK